MAANLIRSNSREFLGKLLGSTRRTEHEDQMAIISENELSTVSDQGQDFYIVKFVDPALKVVITSGTGVINPNGETSRADEQEDEEEKILMEDAACKICFVKFSVGEKNMMQTKCMCKKAYIHKECSDIWAKKGNRNCDVCEIEVIDIPVELIHPPGFEAAQNKRKSFFG